MLMQWVVFKKGWSPWDIQCLIRFPEDMMPNQIVTLKARLTTLSSPFKTSVSKCI